MPSNTAPLPIWATPTVGTPLRACRLTTYAVIPPPLLHLGPNSYGSDLMLKLLEAKIVNISTFGGSEDLVARRVAGGELRRRDRRPAELARA
jgi:hypothetical protein